MSGTVQRHRIQLTAWGKVALTGWGSLAVAAVVFPHPGPRFAVAFLTAVLLMSLLAGRWLSLLQVRGVLGSDLTEGDVHSVELHLRWTAPVPLLAVVFRLRSEGVVADRQGRLLWRDGTPRVPLRAQALHRGHIRQMAVSWETSFPLGLLRHRRSATVPSNVWIFPQTRSIRESVLEELLRLRPRGLDLPQPTGPGDGEFYALREFRQGDVERRVHHRASARLGKKVVREFRGEAPPRVEMVLDTRLAPQSGAFEQTDFEEAIRFCAGLIRSLVLRGIPVRLSMLRRAGPEIVVAHGCRHLGPYLAALATVEAVTVSASSTPSAPPLAGFDVSEGRGVIVHLGLVDEDTVPSPWIAIPAGSRRYYQLLQPRYARSLAGEGAVPNA